MVKFRDIFSDKRQIISVLVILIVKHQNPSLDGATQGDFEITHTETQSQWIYNKSSKMFLRRAFRRNKDPFRVTSLLTIRMLKRWRERQIEIKMSRNFTIDLLRR